MIFLDLLKMLGKRKQHILPNGVLMVIYHGTIRQKSPMIVWKRSGQMVHNISHFPEIARDSGQISIIPKPECFGDFGEVPLLNHHLGDYSAGNVVISRNQNEGSRSPGWEPTRFSWCSAEQDSWG